MTEQKFKKIEDANVFKFEKDGQAVTGEYLGFIESSMYKESYALKLKTEDNKILTVFVNNIVTDKLATSGVQKGQIIKLVYLGKVKNQKGTQEYKTYDLFIGE